MPSVQQKRVFSAEAGLVPVLCISELTDLRDVRTSPVLFDSGLCEPQKDSEVDRGSP